MKSSILALFIGCVVAVSHAQQIAGVVTQTSATTLTLTVTAGQYGVTLQTACTFTTVRLYRPDGPVIAALPCASVLTPMAACTTRSQTFTPAIVFYDTLYYFEVDYFDAWSNHHVDFIPGAFDAPGGTSFVALTPPQVGTTLVLQLSNPTLAGYVFAIGISGSTNTGITISPTLFVSLDQDAIFALAYPNATPGYFSNFLGNLDGSGSAISTITIPYVPAYACHSLYVQGVILGPTTIASIALPLSFAILP